MAACLEFSRCAAFFFECRKVTPLDLVRSMTVIEPGAGAMAPLAYSKPRLALSRVTLAPN